MVKGIEGADNSQSTACKSGACATNEGAG